MAKTKISSHQLTREIGWMPPPVGFYKINSDGSSKGNLGTTSYSVVIHNNDGVLIASCVKGLGVTSNFVVELCGLKDGLLLAKNRSLLPVVIEIDSLVVYHALNNNNADIFASVYNLIEHCRTLLNILGKPPITHVYPEANGVVE